MKKKVCKILVVLVGILFSTGCVASLQDYEPLSSDEANIKYFFISMEKDWNDKDIVRVLADYHDNAEIMSGREQQMFSKKEYTKRLKGKVAGVAGLNKSDIIKYKAPKIKFNGDRAEVRISMILREYQVVLQAKFILIRSDNSWLIIERTYTY